MTSALLRDEWRLLDTSERQIGIVREESVWKGLLRRYVEAMSFLLPQKYHVIIGGQTVCTYEQNFNPFVFKLAIDLSADTASIFDRRMALATALLLCAIEGRQK